MDSNRITVEALNDLKPSFENPIDLICDDDNWCHYRLSRIRVVTPAFNDLIVVISFANEFELINVGLLKYYRLLKNATNGLNK